MTIHFTDTASSLADVPVSGQPSSNAREVKPLPRSSSGEGPRRLRRMVPVRHRVLNTRLLGRSAFVAVLVVGGSFAWHSYVVYRNAAAIVLRAERQEKEGDWAGAVQSLQRYLGLREDAAARVRLAHDFDRVAVTASQKYQALAFFAAAIAAQPHDLATRRRHLELTYELGDSTSALQRAEQLLQLAPGDAIGQKYLALALYARWELKEVSSIKVEQAFEAAHRADSGDTAIAARLARLYRAQPESPSGARKAQLADTVLDNLVQTSSDKAAALFARHQYRREFDLPHAAADLAAALRTIETPDRPAAASDFEIFVAAGREAQRSGDHSQAATYFGRALQAAPDQLSGYLLLSDAQRRSGEAEPAMRTLEQGLERAGLDSRRLQPPLASLKIELGQYAAAEKLLSVMQSEAALLFGQEQLDWLAAIAAQRAKLTLARGNHHAAIEQLKRALLLREGGAAYGEKAAIDARLHSELGFCYATLDQWDLAAMSYQAAAALAPQQANLCLAAAEAWDQLGWLNEAVRQYEEGLAREGAPAAAWLSLADARYRQQLNVQPKKRDWTSLRETLERAADALPDSPALKLLQAEYELADGRPDAAADTLQALRPEALAEPRLLVRLAQAYESLGRHDDADQIVERLDKESPVQATLTRCDLLLQRDPNAPVEEVLRSVIERSPPSGQSALRYRLALIHLKRQRTDEAGKELRLAAENSAGDLRPLQLLSELALASGDWAAAARWAERLQAQETVDGQSGYQFFQAQRLIGQARQTSDAAEREKLLSEARSFQKQLLEWRPYWSATYLLKGRLAQLGRHPDEEAAILAYYEALRLGERRLEVHQDLISLLLRQKRLSEAAMLIDRLRDGNDVPPALAALAVTADVAQGNVERATHVAAAEVRRQPDNAANHLRLSQLLMLRLPSDPAARTQRLNEAEAELTRARELAPRDPSVWSALLTFYHATGMIDRARQSLAEVESGDFLSAEDRPFFLAQAHALLGDDEQARDFFLAAIEAAPDNLASLLQAGDFFFGRDPARAEQCFRRALKIKPDAAAAARKLAALVALRGTSDEEMEEASQILDSIGGSDLRNTPDAVDQRLHAVLLLRRGGLSSLKHAERLLASLVAEGSQQPLDYLLLARIYQSQGEAAKARDLLETLVRRDHPDANHLAAYVENALKIFGTQNRRSTKPEDGLPSPSPGTVTASEGHPPGNRLSDRDDDAWANMRLEDVLDQLSQLEPESQFFRTLSLRARWLRLAERAREIPALVERFLDQPLAAADAAQRTRRLLRVGDLYESLGFASRAESCYRQAKDLSPQTYRPLAIWLARHERPAEAISLCRQAAAVDSSAAPATALAAALASGWATIGERATAEELLADALARHPNDRGLLFSLATLRIKQQADSDAEQLLRRFLALEPKNVVAMNNLAMLLAERHDSAGEALDLIERAIDLAGARSELLDTKGWILFEQQRFSEAEASFHEALSLAPANAHYRFHLAMTLARQGKHDDSLEINRSLLDTISEKALRPKEREELRKLAVTMRDEG